MVYKHTILLTVAIFLCYFQELQLSLEPNSYIKQDTTHNSQHNEKNTFFKDHNVTSGDKTTMINKHKNVYELMLLHSFYCTWKKPQSQHCKQCKLEVLRLKPAIVLSLKYALHHVIYFYDFVSYF